MFESRYTFTLLIEDMRKRTVRSKTKKSRHTEVEPAFSAIRLFFMDRLKNWCNQPASREERTERKKRIAEFLGKNFLTVKNMYLYGQGSIDDWFSAMDYISDLRQETIVQLYDSYPYITQKLNSLSPEQLRMHRNIERMTEKELSLVNKLIEVGLEANRSTERTREDED